ncbi:MAG: TRAP transporter small permease [Rhodospirillaceae bacterium]|jgi:TRAP-type C4-dicarboxylate transport system permease small subunit|nr:TRAP transporter small permease [Rhodospirillaceae bacterium]MBT4046601.1 TRAP transporter small permease [Rhodospirillaceae bacterium]MBT4690298.1 TRAP transporter small permease [Rhodospirillaceae bacterium]MBT5083267.1 TRAP transporter small permease [Rhodospirillaceae bacterium]MBT5526830.1 TRAP transporter small permease [Rhodospirillaceae bacterium]
MLELIYVIVTVLVVTGAMALVTIKAELFMRFIEEVLTNCSVVLILGVMLWVVSEVIARYVFNSPLPGHLEGAELLLPMIVFFGVSYVQARDGHVGMTFVVDALPKKVRRVTDILSLTVSALTCAALAYFSSKNAWLSYSYEDVTMSPPYWPVWPSAAVIPLGYGMLAVRMGLQVLQKLMPQRFPPDIVEQSDLHVPE